MHYPAAPCLVPSGGIYGTYPAITFTFLRHRYLSTILEPIRVPSSLTSFLLVLFSFYCLIYDLNLFSALSIILYVDQGTANQHSSDRFNHTLPCSKEINSDQNGVLECSKRRVIF